MESEKADLVAQQAMIGQIVELISGMAQPTATKAVKAAKLAQIKAKVPLPLRLLLLSLLLLLLLRSTLLVLARRNRGRNTAKLVVVVVSKRATS